MRPNVPHVGDPADADQLRRGPLAVSSGWGRVSDRRRRSRAPAVAEPSPRDPLEDRRRSRKNSTPRSRPTDQQTSYTMPPAGAFLLVPTMRRKVSAHSRRTHRIAGRHGPRAAGRRRGRANMPLRRRRSSLPTPARPLSSRILYERLVKSGGYSGAGFPRARTRRVVRTSSVRNVRPVPTTCQLSLSLKSPRRFSHAEHESE